MATTDRKALLDKVRAKMQERKGGFKQDANEWRAPKVADGDKFKARAFILPPLAKGDKCAGGVSAHDMDELWFIPVGDHWVNKKKYPCPRVYDGAECPMCNFGFSLLSETQDKNARKEISKTYLPRTMYAINLYFPPVKSNPSDLQGKVMFHALPKTIYDHLEECITRNDAGDDEADPQPWGIFYDPEQALPLAVNITHKGGFNNYESTKLLPNPVALAESEAEIANILAMRHDLMAKYPPRSKDNLAKLQKAVDELLNGGNDETPADGGFDSDEKAAAPTKEVEVEEEEAPAPPKKAAAPAPAKPAAKAKPAPAPEPEEEDVVVEEEEEEAPAPKPAPAAKAKAKPAPAPVADDGDDLKDLLAKIESGAE